MFCITFSNAFLFTFWCWYSLSCSPPGCHRWLKTLLMKFSTSNMFYVFLFHLLKCILIYILVSWYSLSRSPPGCHRWLRFPVLRSSASIITTSLIICATHIIVIVFVFVFVIVLVGFSHTSQINMSHLPALSPPPSSSAPLISSSSSSSSSWLGLSHTSQINMSHSPQLWPPP